MKHLFSCMFFLLPFISLAQMENYKLNSYVNPDYKRKELDFEFGSSGDIKSQKVKFDSHDFGKSSEKTESQSLNGNFMGGYHQVANSVKKQSKTNIKLDLLGSHLNDERYDEKNNLFKLNLDFYNEGYYYGNDKKFILFAPNVALSFLSSSEEYGDQNQAGSDEKIKWTQTLFSFQAGVGIGRIEQVGDARLAMYILSDLEKNGYLKRTLNPDEVNEFARLITSVKNKRQFDARIRLIEEITAVDSFLIANGYTEDDKTAGFFTSLYDNWMYAGRFERASGSRFTMGLSPHYDWSHLKNTSESSYNENNLNTFNHYQSEVSIKAFVSYVYEKPANLYWQHSFKTDIAGSLGKRRNDEDHYISPAAFGYYGLGYYPNSRTHFLASYSLYYLFDSMKNNESHFLSNTLQAEIYYYISPRVRLSANSKIHHYYKHSDENYTDLNFSFSAGLQYSIF